MTFDLVQSTFPISRSSHHLVIRALVFPMAFLPFWFEHFSLSCSSVLHVLNTRLEDKRVFRTLSILCYFSSPSSFLLSFCPRLVSSRTHAAFISLKISSRFLPSLSVVLFSQASPSSSSIYFPPPFFSDSFCLYLRHRQRESESVGLTLRREREVAASQHREEPRGWTFSCQEDLSVAGVDGKTDFLLLKSSQVFRFKVSCKNRFRRERDFSLFFVAVYFVCVLL